LLFDFDFVQWFFFRRFIWVLTSIAVLSSQMGFYGKGKSDFPSRTIAERNPKLYYGVNVFLENSPQNDNI